MRQMNYGLRPSDVPEVNELPRLARAKFMKLDIPEQSYFRNNHCDLLKHGAIARALLIHVVVGKVLKWRTQGVAWDVIQTTLEAEHGIVPSVSTLRRWAERVG